MNPATLIPTADALTIHWGWFQFLLMFTFPLHLFAMNAMLGTALTAFICHLRPERCYQELSHELAKVLPFFMAFTINLGVAPLLFVNVLYGHLLYTSTIMMGLFWLAVIPILIIAYYLAYIYDFKFNKLDNLAKFAILFVLLLLMTVGFLFSNNMTMMLSPASWLRWFAEPGGTLLNLADPALLPRYLHMMIGSLAVGGLCVALYSSTVLKHDTGVAEAGTRLGMQLFTLLTGMQILMGALFLLTLPGEVMKRFIGDNALATGLLTVGILLAVTSLVTSYRRNITATLCLVIPLIYVMAFIRDSVRVGYLEPYFDMAAVPVNVQWSPLVFFLVILVLGLAVIAWMLSRLRGVKKVG
ncbi:MAG: hypothetical protein PHH28_09670 [Desulfuromonadaceae bacterium]|nr:hypothetical protein [Desulfuromonadaceae bacterium]